VLQFGKLRDSVCETVVDLSQILAKFFIERSLTFFYLFARFLRFNVFFNFWCERLLRQTASQDWTVTAVVCFV